MGRLGHTIRRFLTAEEVPRWFGLSIVLIYVVGLASVARFGIAQARRDASANLRQGAVYAVSSLADRLAQLPPAALENPAWRIACQRALSEFALAMQSRSIRVVDGQRRVLASMHPAEVTTVVPDETGVAMLDSGPVVVALPTDGEVLPDLLIRTPITGDRSLTPQGSVEAVATGQPVTLYLEARLPSDPIGTRGLTHHAWMLVVVLAVLGALFTTYRCLRQQLRGVSQIADRLESHRDRLEHELESLHIGNTADGVTSAWNELVGLTERLRESVLRTEANTELTRALQHSGGGALAEAMNALPDGIVYVTDEVRFEYLNAAGLRFFGWTAEQARQTQLPDAKAEGAAGGVLELLRGALQPGGVYGGRNEVIETAEDPEQGHSSYRVRVIPLQRAHQSGECIVLIRDVSQQMRAERAREDFITQVTHELRTPLTNIRAYTETLSSGMFEDPNIITECYNVITKETRRLSRLVEDILSVSQLEVGTIELHPDDVDLKGLLNDAVRDVRGLADDKKIDLQLALPAKMESLRGDRDKLAVVFNNLLGNAIKYTKPGGAVVVGCQFGGDEVVVTVKDNGIGIDPSDHSRVFEKFQRARDPDVLAESGTGIGLYTAREIVRRHRGDIELISEKGKGSTFLTRLPRAETRASSLSTPQESTAHAPNPDR